VRGGRDRSGRGGGQRTDVELLTILCDPVQPNPSAD